MTANPYLGIKALSTVYYRWLVDKILMAFCVFVQVNKKPKHVEEERLAVTTRQ